MRKEERSSGVRDRIKSCCESFFTNNIIYYHPTSQIYFVYENKEYVIYNEDEIIFSILKFISENKTIKNEKSTQLRVTIEKNQRILSYSP